VSEDGVRKKPDRARFSDKTDAELIFETHSQRYERA
jgi:hypothetical protein